MRETCPVPHRQLDSSILPSVLHGLRLTLRNRSDAPTQATVLPLPAAATGTPNTPPNPSVSPTLSQTNPDSPFHLSCPCLQHPMPRRCCCCCHPTLAPDRRFLAAEGSTTPPSSGFLAATRLPMYRARCSHAGGGWWRVRVAASVLVSGLVATWRACSPERRPGRARSSCCVGGWFVARYNFLSYVQF